SPRCSRRVRPRRSPSPASGTPGSWTRSSSPPTATSGSGSAPRSAVLDQCNRLQYGRVTVRTDRRGPGMDVRVAPPARTRRWLIAPLAALALLVPLVPATEAVGASGDVVGPVNGGFEEPAEEGQVPGWSQRGGTLGGATVVDD